MCLFISLLCFSLFVYPAHLHALPPYVFVQLTISPKAAVREGFLSLFAFLPTSFGDRFREYLDQVRLLLAFSASTLLLSSCLSSGVTS
jgi:hypothetical protein